MLKTDAFIKRAALPSLIATLLLLLAVGSSALAAAEDYDPITGEPKCMECHTADRKYSIDYTREASCTECHGPGLSERFISINERFRDEDAPYLHKTGDWIVAEGAVEAPVFKSAGNKVTSNDEMALIPAGEFTMGSDDWWPKSQPEHKRNLKAFYMDKYEVTNRKYKKFVDATGYRHPKHWTGGVIPPERIDHPATFVSWHDASAYCKWVGKRLPTEAEWEKAARGTDKRTFPWGNEFDKNKGNTPQLGNEDTVPVGSFPNGVSPYGLHDMAGNVFEWVEDWFTPYPGNQHPDENYGEIYKVVRGGSWFDCTYYKCGISAPTYNRIFFNPYTKSNNFGFRCVKDG